MEINRKKSQEIQDVYFMSRKLTEKYAQYDKFGDFKHS
jgi:hypothetical protein